MYRLIPLKQHDPSAFVSRCKIVSGLVKFDSRYNIRCHTQNIILAQLFVWRYCREGQ